MKRFLLIVAIVAVAGSINSCKKSSSETICYQCRDAAGNDLMSMCGTSIEDAYNMSGKPLINGTNNIDTVKKYCPKK
jgi:hypothetical protein